MRKEAGRGRDGRIRVWFKGELRLLLDLSRERNLIPGVVNASWHRDGAPESVTEAFFDGVRDRMRDPEKTKYYRVEGVRYSSTEMTREFGVSQSTLDSRRYTHGKTEYTRAELVQMVKNKEERSRKINEGKTQSRRQPVPNWFDIEPQYSGQLMERAMAGART